MTTDEPTMDLEELMHLLTEKARGGSVTAMRILFQELRRQGKDDPAVPTGSVIDELAAEREKRKP